MAETPAGRPALLHTGPSEGLQVRLGHGQLVRVTTYPELLRLTLLPWLQSSWVGATARSLYLL
eukprot:11644162-Alexandrium_andersonii.AAC.1